MEIFYLANVIRSFLYMWLGTELMILWFVYNFGYEKYKKSKIIESLQQMIFFLALQYAFISLLPIILSLNKDFHKIAVNFTIPFVIMCIVYVRRFRHLSLWEDKLNLPHKDSIKETLHIDVEKGVKTK